MPPWNENWDLGTARSMLDFVMSFPGAAGYRLATSGRDVLGFWIGYHNPIFHTFHVMELVVAPDLQRRGIGGILMDHLEKAASERGVRRVRLNTRRGSYVEDFYRKRGYGPDGTLSALMRVL